MVNAAASANIGTISASIGTVSVSEPPPIQTMIVTASPADSLIVADTTLAVATGADTSTTGSSPAAARPTSMVGIFPVFGAPPSNFIAGDNSPIAGSGNGDLWAGSNLGQPCDPVDPECKR